MDVLIQFGRYKGQVRDIEPAAAAAMLADGRAVRPDVAPELALDVPAPEVPALFVGDAPSRKRGRR